MATGDLASLADVKSWLGIQSSSDDLLLARLVSAASRLIASRCARRGFYVRSVTDVLDGNSKGEFYLREYPVLSVESLTVDAVAVAKQTQPPYGAGWVLEPWSGIDASGPQRLIFYGSECRPTWARGRGNVSCTYTAGFRTTEVSTVPPSAPYMYVALRPWASDQGVTIDGAAATAVASAPAAGQYSVSLDNSVASYGFAAADAGKAVSVTYGYVPEDLQQACVEIVGERYRAKGRIGEVSKSLGGQETVSFSQRDMGAAAATLIVPFINVSPFR